VSAESVARIERARLEKVLARVSGPLNRENFRREFVLTHGRLALGEIGAPEFRSAVGEVIRKAESMAAIQDMRADGRESWATAPRGSGSRVRTVTVWVSAACVAASLVVVGWMLALMVLSPSVFERPADPVPVTVTGVPAGAGDADADAARELIIEGAYLSWHVQSECGRGPAECGIALETVNANPYGVHFFEDGSAVVPGRR